VSAEPKNPPESEPRPETEATPVEPPTSELTASPDEPTNRKIRRRRAVAGAADGEENARDRNLRLRNQLLKKRIDQEQWSQPLSAREVLDSSLARFGDSLGKWLSKNAAAVQIVVLATVVGAAAYGIYVWRKGAGNEQASTALFQALRLDRGRVELPDTKKQRDPGDEDEAAFASQPERLAAVLPAYQQAAQKKPGSGPSILGRLGEAGILLDQRNYDGASAAYSEVRNSDLANADPDVKGRAIEGIGFCKEGKGDKEGALRSFRDLENVNGFSVVGFYHQARLLAAKGDQEKAIAMLKTAHDYLQNHAAEFEGRTYWREALDGLHRRVDPTSAPPKRPAGLDRQMSMEDLEKLKEQFQRAAGKARGPQPPENSSGGP